MSDEEAIIQDEEMQEGMKKTPEGQSFKYYQNAWKSSNMMFTQNKQDIKLGKYKECFSRMMLINEFSCVLTIRQLLTTWR